MGLSLGHSKVLEKYSQWLIKRLGSFISKHSYTMTITSCIQTGLNLADINYLLVKKLKLCIVHFFEY